MRDTVFLVLLGLAVRLFAPQLLFSLIKRAPRFWLLIMLFYPLLSVYPQELIYRAFFFHRYQPFIWQRHAADLASALAFGFVHIIFGNWLAVALCIIGGLLFSFTYQHTGSLLFTCVDHAIFGNFFFTIGLGRFSTTARASDPVFMPIILLPKTTAPGKMRSTRWEVSSSKFPGSRVRIHYYEVL